MLRRTLIMADKDILHISDHYISDKGVFACIRIYVYPCVHMFLCVS